MPPTPPVPGVIKVAFQWTNDASIPSGSNIHLSYTGGTPTAADLNAICGECAAAYSSEWAAIASNRLTLVAVAALDLGSLSGAFGEWTGTVDGDSSADWLPASAAAVINHTIARRYRGGKPRNYWPAITGANLTSNNELSAAAQTAFKAAWQAMVASILGTTGLGIVLQNIVNVSYYEGFTVVTNPITGRSRNVPKLRAGGPLVDPITNSSVAAKLGSQRRRLNL